MVFVVLTMLVCLLLSAAVALYVAYPARGRRLPANLTSLRATPRPAGRARRGARGAGNPTAEGAGG